MQLGQILDAAIADCRADLGTIQAYDRVTGTLVIARQRGHTPMFLDHFRVVAAGDGSACGRALQAQRVTIEDVDTEASFERHRAAAISSGFRAVHSAVVLTEDREIVGAISVHYRQPHPATTDVDRIVPHAQSAATLLSLWPSGLPATDSPLLEPGTELTAAEQVRIAFASASASGRGRPFGDPAAELTEQLSAAILEYTRHRRARGALPEALVVELKSLLFLHPRQRSTEHHTIAERAITLAIRSYYAEP